MNLWILSQNREDLVRVEHLGIYNKKIYVNGYSENGYCVGEYKTRKRALEVLAEITKMLQINTIANGSYQELDLLTKSNILCNMSKIYIMPSE